jgi:uncharacterized protein (DUF433 family)
MTMDMIGSGSGLYSLKEVALYARIHPVTLSRWLSGNVSGERVLTLEESKVITFPDFVQVLAVRNLRVIHKIPLPKIRDAVNRAMSTFKISYPLARRHTTYLFDKQLWIKPEGHEGDIVQVSGKAHGQRGISTLMERFMVDVSFDQKTGLANEYKAFEKPAGKIIMNPRFRFGEPLLNDCGYTPEVLFEAAKTEGSVEAAAKAYGVSKEQVEVCVDYFDHLLAA